jgi:hypothetical protein
MVKKAKNFPKYTYDYPVPDYEDNSTYLLLYRDGKKIHSFKDDSVPTLIASLEAAESEEDKQFILSCYDIY